MRIILVDLRNAGNFLKPAATIFIPFTTIDPPKIENSLRTVKQKMALLPKLIERASVAKGVQAKDNNYSA